MPAYPSLTHSPGTKITLLDDIKVERASNGALRTRIFYDTQKRRFDLRHSYLTATQRDTLRTFYDTNRALVFSLTWSEDKVTFVVTNCHFTVPIKWECESGVFWHASVTCEEV